jgi:hypothetical protein
MPRFVPASVAELQRVGLFGSLPGEQLTRIAEQTERLEIASGGAFGGTDETVDILLTGLARGSAGVLRPGEIVAGPATALTACIVARVPRVAVDEAVG